MTHSRLGRTGWAEHKRTLQLWGVRSVGQRSGIQGRGKGYRMKYMARMLRGSVGDHFDIQMQQYLIRKRIAVFTRRLQGKLSLPKPSQSSISQPPDQPIGWNSEKQGKWMKSEPFAIGKKY